MTPTRRSIGLLLISAGACLVAAPLLGRLGAQEQTPNRREFSLRAKDFRFTPDRLEVTQNDLVKLTITSEDLAYGFTIDEYRVSKRIPAGGSVTFEFRVDGAPGTFFFYSNMTSDARHSQMRGQLIVRGR
jgi:heme/copper-type cytochrome/quinol oxidase subunit 2